MIIRVLGAAAGGGFPQWNCGCPNCRGVREAGGHARARSQECVAVSADGNAWLLLNCSPEIRAQIESFPPLHPRAPRHSPIAAILLTNGDLDHCLGLLSLRESHPLVLYATEAVRRGFVEGNVLYRTLERFPGQATWRTLKTGREEDVADATGRTVAYVSAAAGITADMRRAFDGVDAVFFDGTFWSSDELPGQGLGTKRAEDMAHLPVGGPGGSLERLGDLRARRRIYIHVNNTNPMLRDDSPQRAAVIAAGWEVAEDG